jgi:UPF0755 protein
MRALLRALLALSLVALLAAGGLYLWARQWIETPVAGLKTPVAFEVARGATLRSVAASLEQQGLLDEPRVWIAWARLTGRAGGLKAGEYELQPGMSPHQLLDLLSSGDVILHSITFVEGSLFADMRKALVANEAVRNERQDSTDEEIMRALGAAGVHPEGQFFPDTYHFARGTTDLEILQIAHRRLREALETAWLDRAPELPLASPYEALILASIVEKETALDSERPQIAGVFVERLRRGMRLQTDPTVIYGMMATYDGNIRRADLLRDTPYNTYTRAGLPPTPIAMPGLDSIRAAVKPDVTGALFFVATGAGDGSHYFSKTLAEHNAAVRRYLRTLRER